MLSTLMAPAGVVQGWFRVAQGGSGWLRVAQGGRLRVTWPGRKLSAKQQRATNYTEMFSSKNLGQTCVHRWGFFLECGGGGGSQNCAALSRAFWHAVLLLVAGFCATQPATSTSANPQLTITHRQTAAVGLIAILDIFSIFSELHYLKKRSFKVIHLKQYMPRILEI